MYQTHTMPEDINVIGCTPGEEGRGSIPARLTTLGPTVLAGQWQGMRAGPHRHALKRPIDSISLGDHTSACKDGGRPDLLANVLEVGAPVERSFRIRPEKMMAAAIPEM